MKQCINTLRKNLRAAKALIDWLGTPEAMKLVGKTRSKVTRPGIPGKVKFMPKVIKYNSLWAGERKAVPEVPGFGITSSPL